jgi:hypothetical protein
MRYDTLWLERRKTLISIDPILNAKKICRSIARSKPKPTSISGPDSTACREQNLAALQNHDKFTTRRISG